MNLHIITVLRPRQFYLNRFTPKIYRAMVLLDRPVDTTAFTVAVSTVEVSVT